MRVDPVGVCISLLASAPVTYSGSTVGAPARVVAAPRRGEQNGARRM